MPARADSVFDYKLLENFCRQWIEVAYRVTSPTSAALTCSRYLSRALRRRRRGKILIGGPRASQGRHATSSLSSTTSYGSFFSHLEASFSELRFTPLVVNYARLFTSLWLSHVLRILLNYTTRAYTAIMLKALFLDSQFASDAEV